MRASANKAMNVSVPEGAAPSAPGLMEPGPASSGQCYPDPLGRSSELLNACAAG